LGESFGWNVGDTAIKGTVDRLLHQPKVEQSMRIRRYKVCKTIATHLSDLRFPYLIKVTSTFKKDKHEEAILVRGEIVGLAPESKTKANAV
jgi:hypothetical protein